jgi:hypothetical protein
MKIKILLILSFFSILFASQVIAQEPQTSNTAAGEESKPQKYGVTFPVAELGSCASVTDCKAYCADPVNRQSCVAYAKQKGFYKEPSKRENLEFLNKAKLELGCVSQETCKALCALPTNYDRCATFAKNNNIAKKQTINPADKVAKAKDILGCTSLDECKAFCAKTENQEKCTAFAKRAGLKGGEIKSGPGGCTSAETCTAYCSDPNNFDECSRFGKAQSGTVSTNTQEFKGPGGCTTEFECRAYCTKNPSE